MKNICFLKEKNGELEFASDNTGTGKLTPKDKVTFKILIRTDNPDINSITTEKRLSEQAAAELEKQIGYNLKIYGPGEIDPNSADIVVDFKTDDPYFSSGVLAWAGYPAGSLKGQAVFNNKYVWLDGRSRTGKELRDLGIILPGMRDDFLYQTYNYRHTFKHEVCGHNFGLLHTNDISDVMFPYYGEDRVMYGEESKGSLTVKYGKASFIKRAKPDGYIKSVMKRPV